MKKYIWLILLMAFVNTGCGSSEPDTTSGEDGGTTNSTVDSGASDSNNNSDKVPTFLCPFPQEIPFELESQEFENPESETTVEGKKIIKNENQDLIGTPDVEQIINGRMARGKNSLSITPIAFEWVSVWKPMEGDQWMELGRVKTDEKGYYSVTVPNKEKFGIGSAVVYALLEGDGSCAEHGVFLWPQKTQVVVTDIDGTLTLSDQELLNQISKPSYDPVEMGSASALVNAWSEKGYMVVYLTARPHTFRSQTRQWLEEHDYPFGTVVTADTLSLDDSARYYKGDFLKRVLNEFKWNIIAAYGNAETDIQAYEDAGISKEVTFIIGEYAGESGTQAISGSDYTEHIESYVKKQPDASQPF